MPAVVDNVAYSLKKRIAADISGILLSSTEVDQCPPVDQPTDWRFFPTQPSSVQSRNVHAVDEVDPLTRTWNVKWCYASEQKWTGVWLYRVFQVPGWLAFPDSTLRQIYVRWRLRLNGLLLVDRVTSAVSLFCSQSTRCCQLMTNSTQRERMQQLEEKKTELVVHYVTISY